MEATTQTELRKSLGRVRNLLSERPKPAAGVPADPVLLDAAEECVRLLEQGQRELESARNEQQALAVELANLKTRMAALERSRLFRLLRWLHLEHR